MKHIIIFIFLAAQLIIPLSVSPKSLWQDKNIYSSGTNLNVGDVVVVDVRDISQLRFSLTLNSDNSYNIISNPDTNISGFLPKVSSNKKITSSDKADFSGRSGLNVSIASRIINRTRDGKFTIAGIREYSFNGKINRFIVSGILDPELIKGRSIFSKDIADFKLEIRGLLEKGGIELEREIKPGEAPSSTLTEEEKQKIIIEYLNKMLREINR